MSYMTTLPGGHGHHSWESSPTLTPGSVSSPSCTSLGPEDAVDLEERKGFTAPLRHVRYRRYIHLLVRLIGCSLAAALLVGWIHKPPIPPPSLAQEVSLTSSTVSPTLVSASTSSTPPSPSPPPPAAPAPPPPSSHPFFSPFDCPISSSSSPASSQQGIQRYDHYMEEISRFFTEVPLNNPDGLGFAQMGFRTRLYSKMLAEEKQNTTLFTEKERNMWFFLPGIEKFRLASQTRQADGKPTRGIMLSVDTTRFIYACHFLSHLRVHHKSSMPVEVFYLGDSDLPQSLRNHLSQQYDVTLIDLSQDGLFDTSFAKIGGYAIKPYALLATTFSEVMMVDADTVLLASPETFFDQKGYKENGTLFFQDRLVDHFSPGGHDFIQQQMGYRQVSHRLSQTPFWNQKLKHLQESGVVVVDRSRPGVFSALLFAAWMNGKLMRETVLDRHFWGDKESFWMAFELADIPYYMVDHSCGAIGKEHAAGADFPKKGFCTEHPLHFFDNQHDGVDQGGLPDPTEPSRTLGKPAWFNGSMRNNKYKLDITKLLDPSEDTIWVMNGTWTYSDETRGWCLTNYKRFGIHEYDLGVTLGKLGRASREGERLTAAVMG